MSNQFVCRACNCSWGAKPEDMCPERCSQCKSVNTVVYTGNDVRSFPPLTGLDIARYAGYLQGEPPPKEIRIIDPTTGGAKGQKPERMDLIPSAPLLELARVYGYGAQKYDDNNYLKGYNYRLNIAALLRHVHAFNLLEDRDSESGLHHLAHAAWHCFTLMMFQMYGLGTDDRWKPKNAAKVERLTAIEVADKREFGESRTPFEAATPEELKPFLQDQ